MGEARRRSDAGAVRWPVVSACLLAALAGATLMLGGRGGENAAAATTTRDLEGRAWIMQGVAYNTQQPVLHEIVMPPGGSDDTPLYYNMNESNQFVLSAQSSHVNCNSSGNTLNAASGHAFCQVVLEGFGMWVGPYQIIKADRIVVSSSSTSSASNSTSYPGITIEGLCVYIEQDYANGCRTPGPGESVTFERPPIHGTVSYGETGSLLVSSGGQLGSGSTASALHVDLHNDLYGTSTGINSVIVDIAYAESFAGQPDPTPTPTRTPTPKTTPTKTPTPVTYEAIVPVLSRDD